MRYYAYTKIDKLEYKKPYPDYKIGEANDFSELVKNEEPGEFVYVDVPEQIGEMDPHDDYEDKGGFRVALDWDDDGGLFYRDIEIESGVVRAYRGAICITDVDVFREVLHHGLYINYPFRSFPPYN